MARTTITNAEARDLDHEELIERVNAVLAQYDAPEPGNPETEQEWLDRLSRTIEEMPEIYRWLLSLQSWMDHWSDAMKDMGGASATQYKRFRQRRDFFEKMASAAKQRYEAASRLITIKLGFDEGGMPKSRKG